MKKLLCIGLVGLVAGAASAELLLSWDGSGADIITNTTLNVDGRLWGPLHNGRGSNDGWFGPDSSGDGGYSGANTTEAKGYNIAEGGSTVDVRINNNSGQDLELASLVFDYQAIWLDHSPKKVEVILTAGHLDDFDGTVLATIDNVGQSGGSGGFDYPDFLVNLQSLLGDNTLAHGEYAHFTLKGIDSAGTANGVVDNIALTGTVIPEPATMGLMVLGSLGALFIRRISK